MRVETYNIIGTREFRTDFPLPTLTIIGVEGNWTTARLDAQIQALDFWRSDDNGIWNNYHHGTGNIKVEMTLVANDATPILCLEIREALSQNPGTAFNS